MSDLISWLAAVKNDPLAFARGAFPWGEAGTVLEKETLLEWQVDLLSRIRDGLLDISSAIKEARTSGHGIGKSCIVSIITIWAFTTFPDTRGVITANTEPQLKTKTWAELGKWFNMFIGKDHFELTATALLSRDPSRARTWRIDMVPWNEKNPEAFAGLHNKGKRILLVFDEGSGIPDIIYETAEGALTDADTQIIWLVFGNPTKNTGRFRELFPGGSHHRGWNTRKIDSRDVEITNKQDLADKIANNGGEDSDYVRIRIRGEFPRIGEMEFISAADVDAAMSRDATSALSDPLALGVDVARYGTNASVIFPRKGRDASSIPRRKFHGLSTVELANKVSAAHADYRSNGIFVDGGGVGGGVVDNIRQLQLHCWDIQFGGKDDVGGTVWGIAGERFANKRAAMYGALRAWIRTGSLPPDPELRQQLISIHYTFNVRNEIQLESKDDMARRGVPSPDDADALALTFAYPLPPVVENPGGVHTRSMLETEYNPFDEKRMYA